MTTVDFINTANWIYKIQGKNLLGFYKGRFRILNKIFFIWYIFLLFNEFFC